MPKKISADESLGNFFRPARKEFNGDALKVGSVCNSPFQNSLQEKRTINFFFSFLQLC